MEDDERAVNFDFHLATRPKTMKAKGVGSRRVDDAFTPSTRVERRGWFPVEFDGVFSSQAKGSTGAWDEWMGIQLECQYEEDLTKQPEASGGTRPRAGRRSGR